VAKKKNTQIKNKPVKKMEELGWYFILPLMFIVAIIPLITFAKITVVEGAEMLNWKGGETTVDMFSYYKSIYFSVTSIVAFGILCVLRLTGQMKFVKSRYYIPLIVYGLCVVLSCLMSDYSIVARRGFVDLFQGVWVLIGYALIIVAGINYIQNEKHVKLIIGAYVFIGVITAFIGIGQYLGHDIFKSEFGKYLILPEKLHPLVDSLKFNFGEKSIYATMYNTNYVGSFSVILISIAIALFMYSKGIIKTLLAGGFLGLMVVLWVGSNSRAGIIGMFLGLVFIVLLYRKTYRYNIKKLSGLCLVVLSAVFILNSSTDGAVFREFKLLSLTSELTRLKEKAEKKVSIEDIVLKKSSAEIITENESLKIIVRGSGFLFEDGKGESIEPVINDKVISFEDEAYSRYKITIGDDSGKYTVQVYNQKFDLYLLKEGFRMLSSGGVLGTTDYPDRLEFMDGYEEFASSRGYIWSRSIPMLKNTLFIGHGPGSFAIEFPQKDYIGKMKAFNNETMIVDKPHNMFIQIGVNTGVISLLALLAVCLMYFIDSMKLYWKREIASFIDYMGIGCVTAMISYLGAGIFNDQVISVAPLFYVLVGMGIAVNGLVKKQVVEE
jgi:O-antigen ligase